MLVIKACTHLLGFCFLCVVRCDNSIPIRWHNLSSGVQSGAANEVDIVIVGGMRTCGLLEVSIQSLVDSTSVSSALFSRTSPKRREEEADFRCSGISLYSSGTMFTPGSGQAGHRTMRWFRGRPGISVWIS